MKTQPQPTISSTNKKAIFGIVLTVFLAVGWLVWIVSGQSSHTYSYTAPTYQPITQSVPTWNPAPTPPPAPTIHTYNTLAEYQQALVDDGYYLGPKGADGIYGSFTQKAWHKCYTDHKCVSDAPGDEYVVPPAEEVIPDISSDAPTYLPDGTTSYQNTSPTYLPDGYGSISTLTGRPRTQYVRGYTRSNGTYVAPYVRSPPIPHSGGHHR